MQSSDVGDAISRTQASKVLGYLDIDEFLPSPNAEASRAERALYALKLRCLSRLLGLGHIDADYRRTRELSDYPDDSTGFLYRALEVMNIHCKVSERDLSRIPEEGPLLVVSNHPFGALDGLALCAVMRAVRSDFRVLANRFLACMPDFRDHMLKVDVGAGARALQRNLPATRGAITWLEEGHALGLFPAGEVAHLTLRSGRIVESSWSSLAARLVRRTGTTVLPVFFPGSNRARFHLAGLAHPILRTAMLPREMLGRRGRSITMRVGVPLSATKLARFSSTEELTHYLRLCSLSLGSEQGDIDSERTVVFPKALRSDFGRGEESTCLGNRAAPLAAPVPADVLAAEVAALPEDRKLASLGKLEVYYGHAQELPHVLQEIGRLREHTFRAIGEGTGQPSDLDRFDMYYTHMFAWDVEAGRIAGAYRLAKSDEVLEEHGLDGLYTHSLFDYKRALIERIRPAIELGRSFVCCEYQRSSKALFVIWRGIGAYVHRNPQYATLFGPVSISGDYKALSRSLMVHFLRRELQHPDLSQLVTPRNPLPSRSSGEESLQEFAALVRDMRDLSDLVSDLEEDGKRVPVLLEQYVRLGGRFLSFSVDQEFSNVLDGLVVVDLRNTPKTILNRYIGRVETREFLSHHEGTHQLRKGA